MTDPDRETDAARVQAIRARVEKATEGLWALEGDEPLTGYRIAIEVDGAPVAEVLNADDFPCLTEDDEIERCDRQARADADFIAHARSDIPYLLSLLEARAAQETREPSGWQSSMQKLRERIADFQRGTVMADDGHDRDEVDTIQRTLNVVLAEIDALLPVVLPPSRERTHDDDQSRRDTTGSPTDSRTAPTEGR
jgi:hypothetical protein